MRNFQNKKNTRGILYSRPVLVCIALILLFFMWGVVRFFIKMEETSKNRDIAELKLVELNKNKDKLISDIENLNTDRGKEASIRDKFGLAKEGEGLIVVVDEKVNTVENETEDKNWATSLWSKIFK